MEFYSVCHAQVLETQWVLNIICGAGRASVIIILSIRLFVGL